MTAEAEFLIKFAKQENKFCLILHDNKSNSYLFLIVTKTFQFKAKDFHSNAYKVCLGNISKDFAIDNMKETGLNRYVYNFSVNYGSIDVDDVPDIRKCLMNY